MDTKIRVALVILIAIVAPALVMAQQTGVGVSASYGTTLITHDMRSALPTTLEVHGRFLDLVEAGIFATFGTGTSSRYVSYWNVVTGVEARLAPAGRFYMPYAGLGLAYGLLQYQVVVPTDHLIAGYVSIAPLRFDLKGLFGYEAQIEPMVSLLQIRLGPIYYDGGLPSWYEMGNFLASIDLIRIGVVFGL